MIKFNDNDDYDKTLEDGFEFCIKEEEKELNEKNDLYKASKTISENEEFLISNEEKGVDYDFGDIDKLDEYNDIFDEDEGLSQYDDDFNDVINGSINENAFIDDNDNNDDGCNDTQNKQDDAQDNNGYVIKDSDIDEINKNRSKITIFNSDDDVKPEDDKYVEDLDRDRFIRKIKRNSVKDNPIPNETYESLKTKPLENEIFIDKHRLFIKLPDFESIDIEYRATYKKQKLYFARSLGYKTISGAIYDLYYNKNGSFESVGAMLGYENFSVGIFIKKMGWPTRESGGLQSSKISLRMVSEIRRDFVVKTQMIRSNFSKYYKKIAGQLGVNIETIRRIVYNKTFYDENYEIYAEKIKKVVKDNTEERKIQIKNHVRIQSNRVRFK